MQRRPAHLLIACVVAALPWPTFWLLDRSSTGCGDGLCGFIPGFALLASMVAATLVFALRGVRLGEGPAPLRVAPAVIWLAALAPLVW